MRKIIDGVIYDTEKAVLLKSFYVRERQCGYEGDSWTTDMWHDLYQTRKGTYFFIHYDKKWFRKSGVRESYEKDGWIERTNEEEVKKWLERASPDILIELYGADLRDA